MPNDKIDPRTIPRYLLGELSEKEEDRIEERYFAESDLFEQVVNAEDELIHAYLDNRLTERERRLFEQNILSQPEKRKKVKFMQALKVFAREQEGTLPAGLWKRINAWLHSLADFILPEAPVWRLASILGAIFLAIVSVKLSLNVSALRTQLDQQQAERLTILQRAQELQRQAESQSRRNEELAGQLQSERNQRTDLEQQLLEQRGTEKGLVAISLYPSTAQSSRGGNTLPKSQIEQEDQVVKLVLYLEDDTPYKSYQIYLETVAGDTLWSQFQKLVTPPIGERKLLHLLLTANILAHDDYIITVKGINSLGETKELSSYSFRVAKK
ncbi:hypothetical protein L0337_42115 [candidate division KSB1 bacterium]|nr:hypothetical protein [candidate division KSB1 bacterium]